MEAVASTKNKRKLGKEVKYMLIQTNGITGNGEYKQEKKSRSVKTGPSKQTNGITFDPMKYMLKLPKTKKVQFPNGQVKWEKTEADYLPVAARIAWFRKDHPDWSIITKTVQLANKAVVMKAIIKDAQGRVIATARKKETEIGFADYIEKAETGAVGRALAMCGYGTLQAPEFDESDRLADAPIDKPDSKN